MSAAVVVLQSVNHCHERGDKGMTDFSHDLTLAMTFWMRWLSFISVEFIPVDLLCETYLIQIHDI